MDGWSTDDWSSELFIKGLCSFITKLDLPQASEFALYHIAVCHHDLIKRRYYTCICTYKKHALGKAIPHKAHAHMHNI